MPMFIDGTLEYNESQPQRKGEYHRCPAAAGVIQCIFVKRNKLDWLLGIVFHWAI